ncbi:MAG: hypothetical protein WBD22_06640 [Pyrinomonadaceae bacterium]
MTESEILTLLLEKPGLYIGYGSVIRAFSFIEGYTFAMQRPTDLVYREFGQWLRKNFDIRQDLSWASIIYFVGQSEKGAFDLAKEMWPQYLKEVQSSLENDDRP